MSVFSSGLIISCNGHKSKPLPETIKAEYQCPMKCSEQVFDKPGKCPECGMELEKVTKS